MIVAVIAVMAAAAIGQYWGSLLITIGCGECLSLGQQRRRLDEGERGIAQSSGRFAGCERDGDLCGDDRRGIGVAGERRKAGR